MGGIKSQNGSKHGAIVTKETEICTVLPDGTILRVEHERQEIVKNAKLYVSLLIDVSGSMHGPPIAAVSEQLQQLLAPKKVMKTGTCVDVNLFNSKTINVVRFQRAGDVDRPNLASELQKHIGGGTALYDAVIEAVEMMRAKYQSIGDGATDGDWHRFLIIFTDGCDNSSKKSLEDAQKVLQIAKMKNFNVMLIAAGEAAMSMQGLLKGYKKATYLPIADCSPKQVKEVFEKLKEVMYTEVMKTVMETKPSNNPIDMAQLLARMGAQTLAPITMITNGGGSGKPSNNGGSSRGGGKHSNGGAAKSASGAAPAKPKHRAPKAPRKNAPA